MKQIVPLAALMALTLLLPAPGVAQILEVTIEVDGLACPFCAYSLEKNLKRIGGISGIAINVNQGTATLTPVTDSQVDLEGIPVAVKDAGFTPRDMRVSAAGRIELRGGGAVLVAADGTLLFRLDPNEVLSSVGTGDWDNYEILGVYVLHEESDESTGPPRLSLTRVAALRAEKP